METPVKKMLLEVVDQMNNRLSMPKVLPEQTQHNVVTQLCNDDQMLDEDEIKEEFLDFTEVGSEQEDFKDDYQDDYQDDIISNDENSNLEESLNSMQPVEVTQETNGSSDDSFKPEQTQSFIVETIETSTSLNAAKKKSFRQSNPETWLRNKRKLAKNTGQSYIASNGKLIEAKQMKNSCIETCRMHCSKKINEENRLRNFSHFYQLADIAKQRKFLFDHMKTYEPKRNKAPKSPQRIRAVQRYYFLDLARENKTSELVQVCKLMFLNTFSISSQVIDTLYRKANEGEFNDTRGKFERKQSKAHKFCIKHVSQQSKIDESTSVENLYETYLEDCKQNGFEALNESSYHEICKKRFKLLKRDSAACETDERVEMNKPRRRAKKRKTNEPEKVLCN